MSNKLVRGVRKTKSWFSRQYRREGVQRIVTDVKSNWYRSGLFKNFDWLLFALIVGISITGLVAIFAATVNTTEEEVHGLINILAINTANAPRLQLMWIGLGLCVFFGMTLLDYHIFGKYSNFIYVLNIAILLVVLTVKAGRGGMTAFFTIQSANTGTRTFQPSEFGKVAMIVCLAYLFSHRKKHIRNLKELIPSFIFVLFPMILVFAQPDFGTALVYAVMYIILLYVSGTDRKLIYGVLAIAVAVAIPLWYYLNTASDNFRLTRILMWLHPSQYPDDARQVINGQIAIGSGGLLGKGLVSVGSFASLGYIPDDHTDFCFSIFCEAFGFVGAVLLVIAYALLLGRLLYHAYHTEDKFGEYVLICTFSMFLFHILENICMILGILPVTGIPLPFVSYGGSNYLTNMLAMGLAMNVIMRSREAKLSGQTRRTRQL